MKLKKKLVILLLVAVMSLMGSMSAMASGYVQFAWQLGAPSSYSNPTQLIDDKVEFVFSPDGGWTAWNKIRYSIYIWKDGEYYLLSYDNEILLRDSGTVYTIPADVYQRMVNDGGVYQIYVTVSWEVGNNMWEFIGTDEAWAYPVEHVPPTPPSPTAPYFEWHDVYVGDYDQDCSVYSDLEWGSFSIAGDEDCNASIDAIARVYYGSGDTIKLNAKLYSSMGGGISEQVYAAIETLDGYYPIDVVETGPNNGWPNYYEVILNGHEVEVAGYGGIDPQLGPYVDINFKLGFDGYSAREDEDVSLDIYKVMVDDVVVFEP